MTAPPVVWCIGGTDSGGGAGLAADQRAVDAFDAHGCPVVAAVTAQHSRGVTRIEPLSPDLLDAQLAALADDMPPRAVKTGLLGGAAQVRVVARWIDRLRVDGPIALVVDPVLAATTGARFADEETRQAYRDELLPRATVVTPNRGEARRLLGRDGDPAPGWPETTTATRRDDAGDLPTLARALQAMGAASVCITGGDSPDRAGQVLDWLASPPACGWLASPRIATAHHHGTGCTFASSVAAALARGFVDAEAIVLAKMSANQALRHGHAAGRGAGPVMARPGFGNDPTLLPRLSWGEEMQSLAPARRDARPLGLYAIVDGIDRLRQVLDAGVRTVQLRIKTPAGPDAAFPVALRDTVRLGVRACAAVGARLFVNDHWELARELGAGGVHLGQEDLLALGEDGRRRLAASGLALGISSHSVWELCRALALAPAYVACGPVWPTLTKAMPWRPQGLGNLRWWRHMADVPVVAIGGILSDEQARAAAACGVDGVCVVRGLGEDPARQVPPFRQAIERGAAEAVMDDVPALPTPSLGADATA